MKSLKNILEGILDKDFENKFKIPEPILKFMEIWEDMKFHGNQIGEYRSATGTGWTPYYKTHQFIAKCDKSDGRMPSRTAVKHIDSHDDMTMIVMTGIGDLLVLQPATGKFMRIQCIDQRVAGATAITIEIKQYSKTDNSMSLRLSGMSRRPGSNIYLVFPGDYFDIIKNSIVG